MTIRQKFEEALVNHGLWPEEAAKVMDEAQEAEANEAMQGRWDDDITGYPPQLFAVAWMSIKHQAVEHLKANKPQHFALAMLSA